MELGFCLLRNMRPYSIELRERNYPKFEGRYNAYVSVYGQLSGQYLGAIEEPIAMDITEDQAPELILKADQFITEHWNTPISIW